MNTSSHEADEAVADQWQRDLARNPAAARADGARRFFELGRHLHHRRRDEPHPVGEPDDGIGDPHAEDRLPERRQRREEQEHPEERETDQQSRHRARHQHQIVDDARPAVVAPMRGEADRRVARDGDGAPDRADENRVPDRANMRGLVEDGAEVVEREAASARLTPKPQLVTKARSAMPDSGTMTLTNSQNPISPTASHFHLPSGSSRMRPALPLIVAYLRAFCKSLRWRSTSGIVRATMQIATAAIR